MVSGDDWSASVTASARLSARPAAQAAANYLLAQFAPRRPDRSPVHGPGGAGRGTNRLAEGLRRTPEARGPLILSRCRGDAGQPAERSSLMLCFSPCCVAEGETLGVADWRRAHKSPCLRAAFARLPSTKPIP